METSQSEIEPFDLFISYNHNSLDLARHFYYTAIANGINPWMDEAELTPGSHLPSRAEQGINLSKRFFLIATNEALKSRAVITEIDLAIGKFNANNEFPIMIYKPPGTDLALYKNADLRQFIYLEDESDNPFPVMSRLIESITGKNMLVSFLNQAFSGAATAGGLVSNMPASDYLVPTIASLIMQIKTFLNNTAFGHYPQETLDSIQKLLNFTPIESLSMLQPGWIALGNGVFENLHPTRTRIPPRIRIENLPNSVTFKELFNNEVITRIQFIAVDSGEAHLGPIPFRIELDAEL